LSGGAAATPVNASLTGLTPATTYHFRAVATNSLGTTLGDDLIFHTGGLTNLVTNMNDSGPGSLRDAIANFIAGDYTNILFAPGLSGQTILLTSGQIVLSNSLTIDASTLTNGIAINGNHASRIFKVNPSVTVVLNSLTITNGYATAYVDYDGGGIYNWGTLTLNQCTLTGNTASRSAGCSGGGIYNNGTMTLNQCTLAGNTASKDGGGICNNSDATLTVNNSTLAGNLASYYGGGIRNGSGTLTLQNSTLANNTASEGGGILNATGTLTLQNSTLANNSADYGGGIYNTAGTLNLTNTIVAGNTSIHYPEHPKH
jgi:hypothetical protein